MNTVNPGCASGGQTRSKAHVGHTPLRSSQEKCCASEKALEQPAAGGSRSPNSAEELCHFCVGHAQPPSHSAPKKCGLTRRSRRGPTASHQARAGGTLYIFTGPGLASCRRSRLNSNVRRQSERLRAFAGLDCSCRKGKPDPRDGRLNCMTPAAVWPDHEFELEASALLHPASNPGVSGLCWIPPALRTSESHEANSRAVCARGRESGEKIGTQIRIAALQHAAKMRGSSPKNIDA